MRTPARVRPGRFAPRLLTFVLAAMSALTVLATSACAEELERSMDLEGALRRRACVVTCWEVDQTVIAAAEAPGAGQVRDRLAPALVTAKERHAGGYDRLRAAVCRENETMSGDRARACSTVPAELEDAWWRSDRMEQWVIRGVATAAYAGAMTETTVEPKTSASRDIATAAVVPIGAAVGMTVFALVANNTVLGRDGPLTNSDPARDKIFVTGMAVAGAIVGGVVAGRLAYSRTASSGSRSSVTFWALTPFYLTTMVMTVDW